MARGRVRLLLTLACAALLGAVAPAAAQEYSRASASDVAALRPGEFVWYDDPALLPAAYSAPGPVSIVVSIPAQRMYVYRDSALIGVSTVSTGSPGRDTPTGEFTILQKQVFHRSNLYSNAPMPFMQRLTWDGIALHAGHLPGYPASHGCIRLPKAFAKQLYQLTAMGGSVSVIDEEIDDSQLNRWAPPTLAANPGELGGERFNLVTMGSTRPPPALVPVADDGTRRPTSWVTGPAVEIVQPIPTGTR
jgi:hypothetical protein